MRRALTKHEAGLVTERQKKKRTHFPMRKYAVKVFLLSFSFLLYLAIHGFNGDEWIVLRWRCCHEEDYRLIDYCADIGRTA